AAQDRAILVDLPVLLPVDVIEVLLEERRHVGVHEGAPAVVLGDLAAPRVAARADLDLPVRRARDAAPRVPRLRVDRPLHASALVEQDDETFRRISRRARSGLSLRPRDVVRARAVARLAGDVDLLPPRAVAVR